MTNSLLLKNKKQVYENRVLLFMKLPFSVYDYSTKEEVTEGIHLKNNEYYVAVGSEKFRDVEYGLQPTSLSPKQQQKR